MLIQKMLELGELKNGEYPLLTEEGWNRMIISGYPNELDYVNVQLQMRGEDTTSFMWAFCTACLRADSENYELLRPGLHVLMQKFPADPKRLAMEREDSLEL